MKKIFILLILIILVISLSFVSGFGAAKEQLVITSWSGLYEEAFVENVVKPFEEKYNVEVILLNPGNSTQILARLRAEAKNPQIDIVQIGGGLEAICAEEGLVEDFDYSTLSNWDDLIPGAKLYPNFGPGTSLNASGILYHTERMPFELSSWLDLWDERLSGEGEVSINNIDTNYGLAMLVLVNELEGGTRENLDPGFNKFKELMKSHRPLISVSSSGGADDVVMKGAYLSISPQSRAIGLMKEGYPVNFVYPKEGAFSWPTSIGIVKGTKNVKLAAKFIDFYISPEINANFAMHINYSPVNSKSDLSDYKYADVLLPTNIYTLDWEWIGSHRAEWIERWNIEVLSIY